ncbi:hypothetical protein GGH12_004752 [Coemansia sp. RSA 1822]|nr:hypothetical protein LPJ76_004318 [Coemansia sp. RSA 638]KAJ2120078.1 hypothetical protein IW147_005373 [Coemansia sp. RSA 720]KAJ2540207.1 hypothetical protein GGF49_004624 [Coemansia sp. RSA 1853]KAJ2560505.1 hypothetical protein GGH12_004752 [Coemansia sp. RSA 1822]
MPPKRPRNLRTSRTSEWDEPADPSAKSTDTDPPIDPADLLEYQKLRTLKPRGIDSSSLAKGERKKKLSKAPSDESTPKPTRSLDGAFTQQNNKLDANKHMLAFIEHEMQRNQGTANTDDAGERLEDDLYAVPSHLRVVEERPVREGNVAMASKMLTSIQEVDLGAEAKSQNASATTMALTKSQPQKARNDMHGSSRYRRQTNPSDRSTRATDDAVLQRFKKRMRR